MSIARRGPVDPDRLTPDAGVFLAIAFGGVAGTGLRYALTRLVAADAGGFPWAIFVVNVTGCFALGVVLPLLVTRWPDRHRLRAFATIGVLGGYTTFSTFVVDANLLTLDGHAATAIAYVVASLVAGPLAVVAGMALVRTARA